MTIRLSSIQKIYKVGVERVHALRGVDLSISKGEFVAIMGSSGSGKSTLMNILGCLDRPSKGEYVLNGKPVAKMGAAALAEVRNQEIGFVFQSFELLPRSTALQNVMLPLIYSPKRWMGARKRARGALDRVGLGERVKHRPNQLSGGQRQRVAIARALVNEPSILLADEPTGNLDSKTSEEIIALFKQLHADGQTIVIVTHEEDIAGHAERIVRLKDGRVMSDRKTTEDPIHREYLDRMAVAAADMAKHDAVSAASNGAPLAVAPEVRGHGEAKVTVATTAAPQPVGAKTGNTGGAA
ncbi:MAG: ABC transporter ATP-binding protein [Phycisphaerales bacterium]|nr:ABC transporter ATP-binding protein [Phycisphaerales bacterium]